jgi:P4 family phage/plasmid primase-like protien
MNEFNMTQRQFRDLNEFLYKHSAKTNENTSSETNSNGITHTHTRIPNKELNIYPASYIIPNESLPEFYALYYDHIFVKKKKEYLTEKQLDKNGALLVDFDFRYVYDDVDKRQHTKEHILDMIVLYLEELKNYFIFEENKPFDIFIFEKPNVNRLEDKTMTKDGIHMMICFQVDPIIRMMLRDKIMERLQEVWELPLINSWDSVLDKGITTGKTNWQLFGSRKPHNEAYELTSHFIVSFDKNDGEFMMDEIKVEDFDMKNNFYKLSAQNSNIPSFEFNPKIIDAYNKQLVDNKSKIKKPVSKTKLNLIVDEEQSDIDEYISINEIKDKETLNKAMDLILKNLNPNEYEIKETHMYTQILPAKYYEPGSHLLNRQVAFALKHTDERLFLSWIMLRSKASDFDYETIPSLYNDWKKYFNTSKTGVTRKSILYWARQDAFEEYEKVLETTLDYYIEESLGTQTECDIAQVVFQKYKDTYVCVSYDKKGVWFVFKNHRWESDKGLSLRLAITKDIHNLYLIRRTNLENEYHHYDQGDDRAEFIKKKMKLMSDVMLKLKRTNDKNNIMREAMELFYDKDFIKNMDTNKHLLCFNNGVIDFKTKEFRHGYPQDYITKSTRINYIPFNTINNETYPNIVNQIHDFMNKLFPIQELNKYMWNHLASCLIGTNKNQTFNVYHGSGSNGKSMLTDLMTHALGDYKGTVPITLVTEKRNAIGGTSSEIIQLKGIRYAVMNEPSKGMKLNEGIMKELTGGDPIQGRALYCESETFEPQFNLVVCTNNLFDIESNDDGTWRRIRKCDFVSKFRGDDEPHTDDSPYIFEKDKDLKHKLPIFAPIFTSMLVNIAFETEGNVPDCEYVLNASNKYRNGQDHIAAFVLENIIKTGDNKDRIKKQELAAHFKEWFIQEQGNKKMPKGEEIYMYMDKKYGFHKQTGWHGVKISYHDEDINQLDDL